jgi:TPR repeat protein
MRKPTLAAVCAAILIAQPIHAEDVPLVLNPTNTHEEMMLGLAYWIGARGLPRDRNKGYALLKHAADEGDADAMNNIGAFYAIGEGVPCDPAKAMMWYQKAADRNDAGGYYNVGHLYFTGEGVPQDYAMARKYFEKALAMPVDDFHREVHGEAANNLGVMYIDGRGVAKDVSKGIAYYEQAAANGQKTAKVNLAKLYINGKGVPKDVDKGLGLLQMEAEAGNALSSFVLAGYYGQEKNPQQKLFWLDKAAHQGNADAMTVLAATYREGDGVPKDLTKAAQFYAAAARLCEVKAQADLGGMQHNGKGCIRFDSGCGLPE